MGVSAHVCARLPKPKVAAPSNSCESVKLRMETATASYDGPWLKPVRATQPLPACLFQGSKGYPAQLRTYPNHKARDAATCRFLLLLPQRAMDKLRPTRFSAAVVRLWLCSCQGLSLPPCLTEIRSARHILLLLLLTPAVATCHPLPLLSLAPTLYLSTPRKP